MDATPLATPRTKCIVMCDWDEVPHLTDAAKARMLAAIPPSHRQARRAGVPTIGAGLIYPVPEAEIKVADFEIPKHWPRGFGMDAGGSVHPTAATWAALDREAQVLYIYSCYKRASAETAVHADAIKARGAWIPGVGDCAALIITAHDAEQLIATYRRSGLDLELPDKAVETGIQEVWELLSTGRLKVFASCVAWFEEYRLYRRDAKGRIVKSNDDLQDSTRYLIHSGRARMKVKPVAKVKDEKRISIDERSVGLRWMA